jgi:toxin ParE1/3/4
MGKKCDIQLLPAAYSDLDEIFNYIIANNPQAAEKTLDKIIQSLRRLEDLPYSGTPLVGRSLTKFSFRMVIVDPYIAFYRLIDDRIYVYRVLHGARNYQHLLKELLQLSPSDF